MPISRILDDHQCRERRRVIAFLVGAHPNGVHGVEPRRAGQVGGIEHHHAAELAAPARRDGVILALHVRDHHGAWIGEQGWYDDAHALARAGGGEDMHDAVTVEAHQTAERGLADDGASTAVDARPPLLPG